MERDVWSHVHLPEDDVAFLKKLAEDLPILADISRADMLLCVGAGPGRALVVAQAMPHSVSPVYEKNLVGQRIGALEQPELLRGLRRPPNPRRVHTILVRGATIARQLFPVFNPRGQIIAVLAMDAYWLAYERQRRRSPVFQRALRDFQYMVLRGELRGAAGLTPFGEHDGVMFVGADRRIHYTSGIAAGLYRYLGYRDSLVGRRVSELDTADQEMVGQAIAERRCLERQDEQYGRTWIRRVLPIFVCEGPLWARWRRGGQCARNRPTRPRGAFVLIHDATEALEAQRELESKLSLLREVHHRVKNNLQVIASLMRMQARRVVSEEAKAALAESVNRILSVAVVHEFLSQNAQGTINLREVAQRIVGQTQQGLVDPHQRLHLAVKGPDIWLPAERSTQCALIINELLQNAIEHGLAERQEGHVVVELADRGETVSLQVADDGRGLPEGFDLNTNAHLGLRIVQSMVERDLRGRFSLVREGQWTRAYVDVMKSALGGE